MATRALTLALTAAVLALTRVEEASALRAASSVGRSAVRASGSSPCVIRIFGVGGGGSNAVGRMLSAGTKGADFFCVNTDVQALDARHPGSEVLQIGTTVTRGLGAGGDPAVGKLAAEESQKLVLDAVTGTDLAFVVAGMGGGTGSGAAPVIAQCAKEAGCLTIGVVTKPFLFEGARRMRQAVEAVAAMRAATDALIVVSNDKLLASASADLPIEKAFEAADDVLRQGVVGARARAAAGPRPRSLAPRGGALSSRARARAPAPARRAPPGLTDIITTPGLINVDFADVCAVMADGGLSLMGVGSGSGEGRAVEAARAAVASPLLDFPVSNAAAVLFTLTGPTDLALSEVNAAARLITESARDDANIILGALVDPSLDASSTVTVTVVATGMDAD